MLTAQEMKLEYKSPDDIKKNKIESNLFQLENYFKHQLSTSNNTLSFNKDVLMYTNLITETLEELEKLNYKFTFNIDNMNFEFKIIED